MLNGLLMKCPFLTSDQTASNSKNTHVHSLTPHSYIYGGGCNVKSSSVLISSIHTTAASTVGSSGLSVLSRDDSVDGMNFLLKDDQLDHRATVTPHFNQ